jgi:hypothetical protein
MTLGSKGGENKMIRTLKIINLVALMVLASCGGTPRRTPAPEPAGPAYNLLVDDGNGVIFTAYETTTATPAQIKLYDNDLRMILNGETFPGSTGSPSYVLEYVPSRLVLFDVDYNGEVISEIVCEESDNVVNQLYFDDHVTNSNVGSGTADDGIYWAELLDMNGVALVADRLLPCLGGGKSFNVKLFKENEVTDPTFTLYMDFVQIGFRGRIVVTQTGKDPEVEGVALDFN